MSEKRYIAIDLKSFYASVECVELELDPMTTNLVVADASRTEKTICLAVSPALKEYGIPGRARLFEVVQQVRQANRNRQYRNGGQAFLGKSVSATELKQHPELELDYIAAVPRMALYMKYSRRIYEIYLRYVSAEDIHVYSIDEVFIDVTPYLAAYHMNAHELAVTMIREVFAATGITATAGIGTNLYLAKIAMDIVAKKMKPDEHGVRIAEINERSYRELLWDHVPLTDFWRLGVGYARKLEEHGLHTMGDIARCSIGERDNYYNEELLYQLFGINAELLIDHAWGWEPTTIAQIKAYRPEKNSISTGQVLQCPYDTQMTRLIVSEMTDLLVLDLVDKCLVTDQIVLTVGYDIENLSNPDIRSKYHGAVTIDRYGRRIPKHAHGTVHLQEQTSSTRMIMDAVLELYDRIINPALLTRRITIAACNLVPESEKKQAQAFEQLDLFTDYEALEVERTKKKVSDERERNLQHAILDVQKKYGKNAMLKGMSLQEGATTIQRNGQVGGHKA